MDANCTVSAKCANCLGPFKAGHNNCPAAPVRKGGKAVRRSKKELRSIRAAGIRATQAARQASLGSSSPSSPENADSTDGVADLDVNSPTPSPPPSNSATKRVRAIDFTNDGNTGSSRKKPSSIRPSRSSAPKNMNVKALGDANIEEGLKKRAEEEQRRSNRYSPLEVTSAEELEGDDEMIDVDTQ